MMHYVNPGQRFQPSADEWNQIVRKVNELAAAADPTAKRYWADPWCWVRNTSGADRDRYDVMGIGRRPTNQSPSSSLTTITGNIGERPVFDGIVPTEYGRFCVLLEPLKQEAVGRAIFAGVAKVRLDVGIALGDGSGYLCRSRHADVVLGECAKLRMYWGGGAEVLSEDSGDEGTIKTRWAYVRLGPVHTPFYFVELAEGETLRPGMTCNGTIVSGATGTAYLKTICVPATLGEDPTGAAVTVRMAHAWDNGGEVRGIVCCVGLPGTGEMLAVGYAPVPLVPRSYTDTGKHYLDLRFGGVRWYDGAGTSL